MVYFKTILSSLLMLFTSLTWAQSEAESIDTQKPLTSQELAMCAQASPQLEPSQATIESGLFQAECASLITSLREQGRFSDSNSEGHSICD